MGSGVEQKEPTREEWAFARAVHRELGELLMETETRSTSELLHIVRSVVIDRLMKSRRDPGTPVEQSLVAMPRNAKQEVWEIVRAPLEALISAMDESERDENSISHAGAAFWGSRLAAAYYVIDRELNK
jgi:hypothetical protein